jgi:enoyl-CoA hydratase/carnithine racemase
VTDHLLVDVDPVTGVATVTLDRPHATNAFTQSMLEAIGRMWRRVRTDDSIRAVLLHGSGESRGFTSGVDVRGGDDGTDRVRRHPNVFVNESVLEYLGPRMHSVWKPVVTAVHGMCAGAGLFLVNESDVVLCSEDAQFFDPHLSLGITSAIGPIGMTRRVNLGEVLRYTLLSNAERLGAETALRIGLVTEVVPREELLERAREIAEIVAGYDPVAVQGTLKAIWEGLDLGRRAAVERAPLYSDAAWASSANTLRPPSGDRVEPRIR